MQDLGIVRGLITLLTFAVFLGICWWAYRPASRRRFQEDALLPFEENDGVDPYELPERWTKRRSDVDLSTHMNFTSTVDIIGGNSGSPVVNRRGEVVGLIFDGNIHGLVLDIVYTEEKARAVSVNAEAIIESLRGVYGMDHLVSEILGE